MTLLHEAQRDMQRKQDSVRKERRAVEISKALRLSAEDLLEAHGTQHSLGILLKMRDLMLPSLNTQMMGRRILDTTLISDGEEIRVTLVSRNKDPRKSHSLRVYIDGMGSHLRIYRDNYLMDPRSAEIVINGTDPPGDTRRFYENPLELEKYQEIMDMVKEKFEPPAPPAQNPQS